MFVLWYSRYLSAVGCSTGGTVIPVSLIAVVLTVLEKSVFYVLFLLDVDQRPGGKGRHRPQVIHDL